jgi:hypothetical protein
MPTCLSCGRRKAKRDCPALGRQICTVCCATKRLVEIACPSDCGYLTAARQHPAAVVQRQKTRDLAFLVSTWQGLTELQSRLAMIFQSVVVKHQSAAVPRLLDGDVEEAARTLSRTLETSAKGVIYEHQADSLPAQRLVVALKTVLAELEADGSRSFERDAIPALRSLEQGASDAARLLGPGDTAFLDLLARLASAHEAEPEEPPSQRDAPRIVIP